VLTANPDLVPALNNLAWLLATAADSRLRDGKRAVQLSEHACRLSEWHSAFLMGTLAAAYAEAGQFPQAVTIAERARDRARADKLEEVARKNEELLRLYLANKAYHESQ
jgi:hypothetical protein